MKISKHEILKLCKELLENPSERLDKYFIAYRLLKLLDQCDYLVPDKLVSAVVMGIKKEAIELLNEELQNEN